MPMSYMQSFILINIIIKLVALVQNNSKDVV